MKNCDNCANPAEVYAMGRYAGDWGGRYCLTHVPGGFMITDRLTPELTQILVESQDNNKKEKTK
jgi:hypothetical protein